MFYLSQLDTINLHIHTQLGLFRPHVEMECHCEYLLHVSTPHSLSVHAVVSRLPVSEACGFNITSDMSLILPSVAKCL